MTDIRQTEGKTGQKNMPPDLQYGAINKTWKNKVLEDALGKLFISENNLCCHLTDADAEVNK